jgi:RimJ/RimL family protein N-acetyltransferase
MRVLRGSGVVLEPQVAAHAAELFAILADKRLYDYLDDEPMADEASLRARLQRLESRKSPDGAEDWLNWIVRNGDGVLVGYVQATMYPDGHADIGYVVGADHWRRGHAFAAVTAVLAELAMGYGVTRLRATCDPANAGSIGLLGRLGFAEVEDAEALPDIVFVRDA